MPFNYCSLSYLQLTFKSGFRDRNSPYITPGTKISVWNAAPLTPPFPPPPFSPPPFPLFPHPPFPHLLPNYPFHWTQEPVWDFN